MWSHTTAECGTATRTQCSAPQGVFPSAQLEENFLGKHVVEASGAVRVSMVYCDALGNIVDKAPTIT